MSLDGFGARREAVTGEESRQQPVHRGLARVKGFAHRPVHHLHPRALRGARAERGQRLVRGQPEQTCRCDGGADVADGAGHVPADVVVTRSGRHRHACLHFEARDECCDGGLARDG
ncbi:MAG: hypothetical protein QOH27_4966 [Mycobacterium sp.]|nr:hypothetical protein [Mycobacterium sp.]